MTGFLGHRNALLEEEAIKIRLPENPDGHFDLELINCTPIVYKWDFKMQSKHVDDPIPALLRCHAGHVISSVLFSVP